MATINSVNNSLTSATGTGSFVGSISPILTGNIDAGSATTFKFPVSDTPTLSATGQLAMDKSISGYNTLLKYYSGSEEMTCVCMLTSDLNATNGYGVVYDSAASKFKMAAVPGGGSADKLVQYIISSSSANDTTTSTSAAASSMTVTITPTSTSNKIYIFAYAVASININALTPYIIGTYYIRRTSGTATTLSQYTAGREMPLNAASGTDTYCPLALGAQETAPATSAQTYIVQFSVSVSQNTNNITGSTYPAFMIAMEVAP